MDDVKASWFSLRKKISPFFLAIALVILLIDQLSKWWVHLHLPLMQSSGSVYPYGGIGVFKNFGGIEFSIDHMTNTGAAWGILEDYQLPLVLVRLLLIGALIFYVLCKNQGQASQLALLMIIAGAVGNIVDFFVFGHVIDMLHFVLWGYDFPVFNVADSAITIGIAWFFLLQFFEPA